MVTDEEILQFHQKYSNIQKKNGYVTMAFYEDEKYERELLMKCIELKMCYRVVEKYPNILNPENNSDFWYVFIQEVVMARRFSDAISIQNGACNPIAIANSIVNACKEVSQEENGGTQAVCDDPAVRLMVHQLMFLTKADQLEGNGCSDTYFQCMEICKNKSEE